MKKQHAKIEARADLRHAMANVETALARAGENKGFFPAGVKRRLKAVQESLAKATVACRAKHWK